LEGKVADRGRRVVSVMDPYGRILDFLDRCRYFSNSPHFLEFSTKIVHAIFPVSYLVTFLFHAIFSGHLKQILILIDLPIKFNM
jgi:hypothetical protein